MHEEATVVSFVEDSVSGKHIGDRTVTGNGRKGLLAVEANLFILTGKLLTQQRKKIEQ
ncbi:hypothetical protein L195_g059508, partial [Trifolium pratense]